MRLGAYQFAVGGSIRENLARMVRAAEEASSAGVRLLAFPECALTGYPPRDLASASAVDRAALEEALETLAALAREKALHLLLGTILPGDGGFSDSALLLSPDGKRSVYHKRALWGWDRDNFIPGPGGGVFDIDGLRVGIRICYEVRFPEYFRELYRAGTDLNILLFYDVSEREDPGRFDLIRAHVRTRAVENVCPVLCVNAAGPHQTAPTGIYDASGRPLRELTPEEESLLVWELRPAAPDFGEQGRREISDRLVFGPDRPGFDRKNNE